MEVLKQQIKSSSEKSRRLQYEGLNMCKMANEVSTYIHEGVQLPFEDWSKTLHSFSDLASIIQTTHDAAQSSAVKAINRMQTMRNWLIGYYIVEFEQQGKDRADYGTQLLKKLEERVNRKGLTITLFKWARKFYRLYPQMVENLPTLICTTMSCKLADQKCATVMHKLQSPENEENRIGASPMHQFVTSGETIISAHPTNPVEGCADANPKTVLPNDT